MVCEDGEFTALVGCWQYSFFGVVELSTPRHSKASEGRGEGIREELVSLHHRGQGFRHTNQPASLAGLRYSRAQGLAELYCPGGQSRWESGSQTSLYFYIPSGKLTFCYGKSPFLMGKPTINGHFQ